MTDGFDAITLIIGFMFTELLIAIPLIAFARLGGWPEGFYRIFRIKYFAFRYYDADGEMKVVPLKWTEIKTHSPSYFDYHGARHYVDKDNTDKRNGRPAWLYPNIDAPFPFPTHTYPHTKISAEAIRNAFNSKQLQDYLKARERGIVQDEKSHLLRNIAIVALGFIMFIILLGFVHI